MARRYLLDLSCPGCQRTTNLEATEGMIRFVTDLQPDFHVGWTRCANRRCRLRYPIHADAYHRARASANGVPARETPFALRSRPLA